MFLSKAWSKAMRLAETDRQAAWTVDDIHDLAATNNSSRSIFPDIA
jgi:hypothetical protein